MNRVTCGGGTGGVPICCFQALTNGTGRQQYRPELAHDEGMPRRQPAYADRGRAEAFGLAADDYDHYRPRYPRALITEMMMGSHVRALDVGAGTGIASAQLVEAGADVLAVEPDPRMARVAADKGIQVEQVTFEDWQPTGRSFDLVVFAQSFHWVQPRLALDKIASILRPGGRLALLSNRVSPVFPTRQELDEAYVGLLDATARPAIDAAHDDELTTTIAEHGYTIQRRHVTERLHYTTDAWVRMVFTYSNVLTLNPQARTALRSRLQHRIGTAGVDAENDATAVICTLG
jgi:SAM-dependent methyltransferase